MKYTLLQGNDKLDYISSEICDIKNEAQKLLSPAVEAHAKPDGDGGRDGVVLKGYALDLPVKDLIPPHGNTELIFFTLLSSYLI